MMRNLYCGDSVSITKVGETFTSNDYLKRMKEYSDQEKVNPSNTSIF